MIFESSKRFNKEVALLKKEDPKLVSKIWELITDISENISTPLTGIGKPEKLKGNLAGYYSRRITETHRLVYTFRSDVIVLVSCYGHYDDK